MCSSSLIDTREPVSFPACRLLLGPFLQSGHGSSIALFLEPLFSSSSTQVLLLQGPWVHTVRGQEEPPPCSQFWCQSCVFVCVNIAIFSGCRYVRFWRLDLFITRGDARAVEVHKVLASLLFLRRLKFCVRELWSTMREGYLYPLPPGRGYPVWRSPSESRQGAVLSHGNRTTHAIWTMNVAACFVSNVCLILSLLPWQHVRPSSVLTACIVRHFFCLHLVVVVFFFFFFFSPFNAN